MSFEFPAEGGEGFRGNVEILDPARIIGNFGHLQVELFAKQHREDVGGVYGIPRWHQVLLGPAETADGRTNLFGALARTMAKTGYRDLKEFQRVDLVIGGSED